MIALARRRRSDARPPSSTGSRAAIPRSDEAGAAVYWAGRAWDAAGDSAAARERWERLAAGDPGSYYTGLALRRLDRQPTGCRPPPPDSFVAIPGADSAMARAALLARLGLATEIRWEYDRLVRQSDSSSERLLALAGAFRRDGLAVAGDPARAPRPGAGRAADARTYRLLYPVMLEDALLAEAREHGLDAGLRGRAHPAGVDVQSGGDLTGRRARADAGDAGSRRAAGPVAGVPGVGPGAALSARREPPARRVPSAGADRPLRPAGARARGLQRRREPGRALVAAHRRGRSRGVHRAHSVRGDARIRPRHPAQPGDLSQPVRVGGAGGRTAS